eukprot:scaffold19_cov114-Cylindrotheca_fusiformis.AAC.45
MERFRVQGQVSTANIHPQENKHLKNRLPSDFAPGHTSVICGRGRECTGSPGNIRFRKIIDSFLVPYSKAKNKIEKSIIVSRIISEVKSGKAERGIFCKIENGVWWEVEDTVAREKVGKRWSLKSTNEPWLSSSLSCIFITHLNRLYVKGPPLHAVPIQQLCDDIVGFHGPSKDIQSFGFVDNIHQTAGILRSQPVSSSCEPEKHCLGKDTQTGLAIPQDPTVRQPLFLNGTFFEASKRKKPFEINGLCDFGSPERIQSFRSVSDVYQTVDILGQPVRNSCEPEKLALGKDTLTGFEIPHDSIVRQRLFPNGPFPEATKQPKLGEQQLGAATSTPEQCLLDCDDLPDDISAIVTCPASTSSSDPATGSRPNRLLIGTTIRYDHCKDEHREVDSRAKHEKTQDANPRSLS